MNEIWHRLLVRQLRKLGLTPDHPPDEVRWRELLRVIARTYHDADRDRYTLERSLTISSEEMQSLYRQKESDAARMWEITANLAEGLYVVDRDGRITFINRFALNSLGWREDEALGRNAHALFRYIRGDGASCPIERVLGAAQAVVTEEGTLQDRQGNVIPVAMNVSPILRDHAVTGAVVSFRDITKRKQVEEDLQQARARAEEAARVKGEFLAAMSHEIRTPMNVVLGMSELLLESALDPEQRHYAETMHQSGKVLLGVINDVLDFSRLESGRITVVATPFSPRKVVEEVTHLMQMSAEEQGVILLSGVGAAVPEAVLGDDGRVRQVLINLIGNAIKFTPEGQVTVSLTMDHQEENTLLFKVTDTGIGIPGELLEVIFDQFIQADAGVNRRYGGSGLGLAISRRLVELMGGRIWVKSRQGAGSIFCFTLPARPVAALPQGETMPEEGGVAPVWTGRPLTILLAEDVKMNQALFLAYLVQTPHAVVVAEDGREALNRVKEGRFDVVIMDVQMPEMDGLTATRLIRAWEREAGRPPMPIIALTAHALEGERLRCLEAGCDRYFTKPIRKKVLLEVLEGVAAQR
ncbi:MAG: response regulator [Magnetococcales bacterium]|nr:response regulator [Magnetococcales bacterium]